MASGTYEKRALSLRALVIFCALLSLCVSDTVGPRLLPLPEAAARPAAALRAAEGADVTPAPSHGDTAFVREAMAAPARKQAGSQGHALHVTADLAERLVRPPAEIPSLTRTTRTPAPRSSAATTRPPGRAPPPSV